MLETAVYFVQHNSLLMMWFQKFCILPLQVLVLGTCLLLCIQRLLSFLSSNRSIWKMGPITIYIYMWMVPINKTKEQSGGYIVDQDKILVYWSIFFGACPCYRLCRSKSHIRRPPRMPTSNYQLIRSKLSQPLNTVRYDQFHMYEACMNLLNILDISSVRNSRNKNSMANSLAKLVVKSSISNIWWILSLSFVLNLYSILSIYNIYVSK